MIKPIIYFILLFAVSGCTKNVPPQKRLYSCLDINNNLEIKFDEDQVFYTWLKFGYGTTAVKLDNGSVYRIYPNQEGARTCAEIKDRGEFNYGE